MDFQSDGAPCGWCLPVMRAMVNSTFCEKCALISKFVAVLKPGFYPSNILLVTFTPLALVLSQ